MKAALYVPYRFYNPDMKIETAMECPDHRIYLIDKDGNVHYFTYLGKNLSIGEYPDEL